MKRINEQRPKAFIGAAISVGTSIVSGIIGNRKKKKAEQAERLRQERLQNLQDHQALASAQNESMMSEEDRIQFLSQYLSKGGGVKTSPRKEVKARIVEGGTAIPIKKDSFLLKGRKHNTGGIVIDAGKTGVEAEGGEVVQVTPKQLKVFSAQPILNGNSPAELVQRGAKPNKVFNAQERFKDINGLNDDGTRKKKVMGGKDEVKQDNTSVARPAIVEPIERKISPADRVNIPVGTKYSDLSPADKLRLKISDNVGKDYKGLEIVSPEFDIISGIRSLSQFPKGFLKGNGKVTIDKNKYYRQVARKDKGIERAKEIGVIDTKQPTNSISDKTKIKGIQLARKKNFEVPFFSRDNLWYGRNKKYDVIIGKEKDFDRMPLTQHGSMRPDVKSNLETHIRATPLVNGMANKANSSMFEYYRHYPIIGMRNVTEGFPTIPITGLNTLYNVSKLYNESNKNNKIRIGGNRKRFPVLTGEYHGANEGRAKGLKSALGVPERRKRLGGLSRKEDYGSSKKPYPSVKSKDFAGGGRSYPIPTKADARDALRLAGLHGRSDVRAKVYKKYPELKKSALGSKTKLLKDNYNNFGLEKDYSKSFAPNALTKANMNSVKTNSIVPTKPVGASISSSTSPLSKSGGFKNFMSGIGGEAISAGIGALGNIISGVTNKNSINNIQAPTRPRTVVPARMRTTYNINPQLAESRDSERNMARLIDSNTSSSSGKIARIQSLANRGVLERNKLRGMKENVETNLLNRSALNRQGVEAANNQVLNAYDNAVTQTENEKIQARTNNRTNIIEGLTSAVRDYQLGMDKRRSEENAIAAMMSANPEQMELFLKLMEKNKGRLGNIRSTLFRCGGKKKIA